MAIGTPKPYLPNPLDYFENGVFNESAFRNDFPNSYEEFSSFDISNYEGSNYGYPSSLKPLLDKNNYNSLSREFFNGIDTATYYEDSFVSAVKNPNSNASVYDHIVKSQNYLNTLIAEQEAQKQAELEAQEQENSSDNTFTSTADPDNNFFGIDSIDTSAYFIGAGIIIVALFAIWAMKRAIRLYK